MTMLQAQIGGGGDITGAIISTAMFFLFFYVYPKLMFSQIMFNLTKIAEEIEGLSRKGKKNVLKAISRKQDKKTMHAIDRIFEFFAIMPVDLDNYGIVRKIEHVVQQQKHRFDLFSSQLAPHADTEKRANITMGLAGGISLYSLSKIMRHYVSIAKKTKSIQIAYILQMQLPLIERLSKSLYRGTKALANGWPIGDGIGPLIIASLMGNGKMDVIEEDTIVAKRTIKGRNVYLMKAKGPGGRLGRPGKAIEALSKKMRIDKIITVDAAAKLEGEKTGSIAEGIGVAMGGIGVERSYIEEVAVKNSIPFDTVIVKMSHEQAISPMRKSIKDALPKAIESIERMIVEGTKESFNVIVIGVGNTSGVGDSLSDAEKTFQWVETYEKKYKRMLNKRKKKGFRLWPA